MTKFATKVLISKGTNIFSVGQAGFIIKSISGQLLAIDLCLSECVERIEKTVGFKRLLPTILDPTDLIFDVVICTHPHHDHFDIDAIPAMIANGRTQLFCSVDCKKLIEQLQMEYFDRQTIYVKPGNHFIAGDFDITFVNCDHGKGAPDAVGVVVKVDGKTIYETGDTCLRLDQTYEIPGKIDVLIAPINGAFGNMDEEDCSELANALTPNVTIPCHYGMYALHHGDVGKFFEIMTEKNLPFKLLQLGEQYSI